ncbi:hypothetical protein WN48_06751 [Eufriesea mexicana]|uniref:Uncharacterized protein n=1 Tax=Eufriesea mexicana TaxID=516756 RepID=A0A310STQ9_9HYME|nr:hypothetical protein WN48_06751 [Eufriesea mexicana]
MGRLGKGSQSTTRPIFRVQYRKLVDEYSQQQEQLKFMPALPDYMSYCCCRCGHTQKLKKEVHCPVAEAMRRDSACPISRAVISGLRDGFMDRLDRRKTGDRLDCDQYQTRDTQAGIIEGALNFHRCSTRGNLDVFRRYATKDIWDDVVESYLCQMVRHTRSKTLGRLLRDNLDTLEDVYNGKREIDLACPQTKPQSPLTSP